MANTTAAIMAVPAQMEPIRLVGDEEKHATLLFFGETSTLPGDAKQTLIDSVELATTMLVPCGEPVVEVNRLGNEDPPALVALLSGENLNQIRNLFLMNSDVSGFRDNTEQFSGFTPHVTLSHPDFTDEAIQRALMRQVYGVCFDRLSVWWNDERHDFFLNPQGNERSMAQAIEGFLEEHGEHLEHSDFDAPVDAFLEHIGIAGSTEAVSPSTSSKSGGGKGSFDESKVKRDKGGMFAKVAGKPSTIKNPKLEKKMNELKVKQSQELVDTFGADVLTKSVDDYIAALPPSQDKNGTRGVLGEMLARHIVEQNKLANDFNAIRTKRMAHGEDFDDEDGFGHSGVRGMKWGVRRRVDPGTGLVLKSKHDVRTNLKTGVVKVTGGSRKERKALKNHLNDGGELDLASGKKAANPLKPRTGSADQIQQDRIQKKIDLVGVHSLSNVELQAYTRRLQMEKDVNRALADQSAAQKAASQSFITKFVAKQANRQTDRIVNAAADIAIEQALKQAGIQLKNSDKKALGESVTEIGTRIKPKKK